MAEADMECDPASDVQMTGEEFFDDVLDQLQKACNDSVAFKSIVAELESNRQAHSQKPVELNKAIIRAIIELPGVKYQQAVHCIVYVEGLRKVLDKFRALLDPMRGRRGAFLLDASVVAGSLIKLLKNNKLATEEWRDGDADKCNDIIVVLKDAQIVSEEQATKIIKLVTEAIFHLAQVSGDENVNLECSGGPPCTSTTVSEPLTSETQSSEGALPESSSDPGTGEFSAVFDHRGGRLGTYWSDDYLEIPKDAIPKGERWRVSGFIHTSLNRYHPYAKYNKGERLIAPVVRYRVEGNKSFKKLVKAVIHHSIRCGCTSLEDKVSVLLQSKSTDGKGRCKDEWLPNKKRRKEGTAYFEVDSFHITVHTHHFSTILCKMCDHEHTEDVKVAAMLFGRLDPDGPNSYSAAVKLYICVQSALNQTAVFFESFHNQQRDAGYVYLGCEYYPQSLRDLEKNDKILLNIQHLTPGWNFLPTDTTVMQDYEALDYIPCLKQPNDPQYVDTFAFRGQTSNLNGMFIVSIKTERRRKPLPLSIWFSLSAHGGTPSVSSAGSSVSSEQWKLSDKKLRNIARNISQWYDVGIELDLSATELDIIQADTCWEHTRRKAFEMLRLWRDRNDTKSTESQLKAKLRHALESVVPVQTEAINELNNDANRVQMNDDTIGDVW